MKNGEDLCSLLNSDEIAQILQANEIKHLKSCVKAERENKKTPEAK